MTELIYTRAQLSAIEDIYSAVPRPRRSARQWEVELDSWARQLATIRDLPTIEVHDESAYVEAEISSGRRDVSDVQFLRGVRASLLREAGYR